MHLSFAALVAAAAVASVVVTGADASTSHRHPGHDRTVVTGPVSPDPVNFGVPVANPWFPLVPGTTTILRGTDEGQSFRERVHVTHRTRVVQRGITARVVRDVLRRTDGSLAERTFDWYATDNDGNVWYFGERTATYGANGRLESREGSWQAGVHGAVAGLVMPGVPRATAAYRQELWRGHAEDQAWIVGFARTVVTPMRAFHHVVRTFEWSRLEPGVISAKLYAQGVGIVREEDLVGGSERFEVVAVRHH
ncbi:hypothetical protein [Nocardioides sp. CER19]|uniref:hypothetical protein n=1 Tax=Nocardioides sp. CER19 TaxID=3038538 RepID=UPI00244C4A0D|nr:hypothetical protein [Nocardioides sp. CER19]MDH2412896.1 hypothetical protein [Nocardioides sp. CER19]